MDDTLEVPYVLPDGRPIASLKQEDAQVYLYGFEAAEMQQTMTAARAIQQMIETLVVHRGTVKNNARKAKVIPANATLEQRQDLHEKLEDMLANFNDTGALIQELKSVVFVKNDKGVKLPNILALGKKVQSITQ